MFPLSRLLQSHFHCQTSCNRMFPLPRLLQSYGSICPLLQSYGFIVSPSAIICFHCLTLCNHMALFVTFCNHVASLSHLLLQSYVSIASPSAVIWFHLSPSAIMWLHCLAFYDCTVPLSHCRLVRYNIIQQSDFYTFPSVQCLQENIFVTSFLEFAYYN